MQQGYPGSVAHAGTYVLESPTTAKCGTCHEKQVAEFNQSRHGLPAYVAVEGTQGLSQDLMALYEQIPEGGYSPDKSRNAIAALEGEDLTGFTCNACHDIGKPAEDGSVGQCQMCHLRHEFSLEQVRKAETCNYCHIGPDHPQYEIYTESPHGIAYHTMGYEWNWEAVPGTLTVEDFPAATCAICHISGFGATESSHDVGERLTWYLFAPISTRRPAWDENIGRMQGVCIECHNQNFIDDFYQSADLATERVNELVAESDQIYGELRDNQLVSDVPFDEPIDYEYFELWHHWGRTTKFGVWMQGPDYSQWHGAYEVLHSLAKLREMAEENWQKPDWNDPMYHLATLFPWIRKIPIPFSRDQVMMLMLALNFLLLGAETYSAHVVSGTIVINEWIPILFSPAAGVVLLIAGILSFRKRGLAVILANVIFIASMVVGVLGAYFHLMRAILPDAPAGQQASIPLFIWAPPILAPLVYVLIGWIGISTVWIEEPVDSGKLVLTEGKKVQMPFSKTRAFFFLTSVGCLSTVISSVLDHSRTNFSNPWLWVPTIVGIFAATVAFVSGIYEHPTRADLFTYFCAMTLMILTGILGLYLHIQVDLTSRGEVLVERLIQGAPIMAPMLFADIGTIGLIALLNPEIISKE